MVCPLNESYNALRMFQHFLTYSQADRKSASVAMNSKKKDGNHVCSPETLLKLVVLH